MKESKQIWRRIRQEEEREIEEKGNKMRLRKGLDKSQGHKQIVE